MTVQEPNRRVRQRRVRGIVKAAQELGCNRQHLSSVLHGHRQSPPLLARYKALISKPADPKPKEGAQ